MPLILDGRAAREKLSARLKEEMARLKERPTLAIIQVGDLAESSAHIRQKKLFGESIGARVEHIQYPNTVTQAEIIKKIGGLNKDAAIHGIIVQMPLPQGLDKHAIIESIIPEKDIDGLAASNLKLLWENKEGGYVPATTKGILTLLDYYKVPVSGKRVVVVGRSTLVGKPTALALTNRDATVTICHSKTVNLKEVTKSAEILIVAIGKPRFVGADFVSAGAVVVDVGINPVRSDGASPASNGAGLLEELPKMKLVGDVDFDAVSKVVSAISPVPGGVGPMTVLSLFQNLLLATKRLV